MTIVTHDISTSIPNVQQTSYDVARFARHVDILRLMADVATFGEWVKAMRREHKLTQQQLADAARLARTYVLAVEKGRVKLPQKPNRDKMHGVFGTDDSLLEDLGLMARDEFGNEYIPDRPDVESHQRSATATIGVDTTARDAVVLGGHAIGQGHAHAGTLDVADPASRLSGLIQLIKWNTARDRAITKILTGYLNEDADQDEGNDEEVPF